MAAYTRKEPRAKVQEAAFAVQVDNGPDGASTDSAAAKGRTNDISLCGMRISLDASMSAGTKVKITVLFKNPPRHFVHKGIVRWVQKSSVPGRHLAGVEFVDKTPAELEEWRSYIAKRYPELSA